MSKFKLDEDWNGYKAGSIVSVNDYFDNQLSKVGTKVEGSDLEPKNKMVAPKYKKNKA